MRNYTLSSETVTKIEHSRLWRKIEKNIWWFDLADYTSVSSDGIECCTYEWVWNEKLNHITEAELIWVRIHDILDKEGELEDDELPPEQGKDYNWRLYKEVVPKQLWLWKWFVSPLKIWWKIIPYTTEDLVLMTWSIVNEVLWWQAIRDYREFWYKNMIDFVMEVSAYIISSKRLNRQERSYKFERNWKQTEINWGDNWDFRLFQTDKQKYKWIISPYWNLVWFRPEEKSVIEMNHSVEIYNSVEIEFLSIVLAFARRTWININDTLRCIFNFWNELWNSVWKFLWDWSIDNWRTQINLLLFEENENYEYHYWHPLFNSWTIFTIKNNQLIIKDEKWNVLAFFNSEDIEDLIKWVLVQCANWLWRTSKWRVLNVLKYFAENYCN